MIRRFKGNQMGNVAGGVRQLRERPYSGMYGFALDTPEEMAAYADYLEDTYRNESWVDEDGTVVNGKILADDWRNEFKGKNREFMYFHDGKDVYNDFKQYSQNRGLGLTFKDL